MTPADLDEDDAGQARDHDVDQGINTTIATFAVSAALELATTLGVGGFEASEPDDWAEVEGEAEFERTKRAEARVTDRAI